VTRLDRIRRAREGMATDRVNAFLFTDLSNLFYLSGFCGSDGALLLTPKESVLLVDGRYGAQARRQAPRCRPVVYPAKVKGIVEEIRRLRVRRVGFEPEAFTVGFHEALRNELPRVSWVRPSAWHASLRGIKDAAELRLLREANRIVDRAFRRTLPGIRPGLPEREIALRLETEIRKGGAEAVSFPISVASGENSSLPHARSEDRRVREGEPIFIDFGGCFGDRHTLFGTRSPAVERGLFGRPGGARRRDFRHKGRHESVGAGRYRPGVDRTARIRGILYPQSGTRRGDRDSRVSLDFRAVRGAAPAGDGLHGRAGDLSPGLGGGTNRGHGDPDPARCRTADFRGQSPARPINKRQ
jgi:hypothetical protein